LGGGKKKGFPVLLPGEKIAPSGGGRKREKKKELPSKGIPENDEERKTQDAVREPKDE